MNEDEQRGDAPDAAGVQPIKNANLAALPRL